MVEALVECTVSHGKTSCLELVTIQHLEKIARGQDVKIPEDYEAVSKQEALENKTNQGNFNVAKNELGEIPDEVSTSVPLPEALTKITLSEASDCIPKEILDNRAGNVLEHYKGTRNEFDIQGRSRAASFHHGGWWRLRRRRRRRRFLGGGADRASGPAGRSAALARPRRGRRRAAAPGDQSASGRAAGLRAGAEARRGRPAGLQVRAAALSRASGVCFLLFLGMFFQLDQGNFSVAMWTIGFGALGAAVTGIILANTDLFLSKAEKASLGFLESIDLKTLGEGEQRTFKAEELWKKNGAVIMAEAAELSSLKSQLDQLGVPLYAVVKENIGTEVQDFQPYFKGEIFLDEKKRKMLFMGFIRCSVWKNFFRAWKGGYTGNLDGEGFVLGGVFVVGPGKQGVLLEHREKEFGDKVSLDAVLDAVKKIQVQPAESEK
ncbi:hypothetical protein JRQ81_017389 [Phrynocephalus forsythii]|uniref:Peroxiredoxin-like 2A n=1 Tax=Phrynocephalus forsythii TaxID=171643 RepID=A0A9Q0XTI4_9SAUR|nr:hypothetical protein JRQ81_017389 [Phrynocephalus forsythii]